MEIVRSPSSIHEHRFRLWKWYIAAARIRAPDNGGGGGKTVINHGGFGRRNRGEATRRERWEARKVGTKEIYHRRYLASSPSPLLGHNQRWYRRPALSLTGERGRDQGGWMSILDPTPSFGCPRTRLETSVADECGADTRPV